MTYELIVVQAFGAYAVGSRVADAGKIAAILGSEQQVRVVRVEPIVRGV